MQLSIRGIDGGLTLEMSMKRIDVAITADMLLRSHGKKNFILARKHFESTRKKLLRKTFYENSLVKDQKVPQRSFDESVLKRLQNKLSNKT